MTRSPSLLAVLLALSACATQGREFREGRALLRKSEAHERRGEYSESTQRVYEAAQVIPEDAVALRLARGGALPPDVLQRLRERSA